MLWDILFIIGFGVTILGAALILRRFPSAASPYFLIAIAALPAAILPAFSAYPFAVEVGHHNFIYNAIGYAASRGMPPENPFVAGMPINFPWISFGLNIALADAIGISPGWMAKVIAVVCLFAAGLAICLLLRFWDPERGNTTSLQVVGILMALFAGTVFWGTYPKLGINPIAHPIVGGWWESRGVPVAENFFKFTFPVALGAALVAYALAIRGALSRFRWRDAVIVFLCICITSIYPFMWLGLAASMAAAGVFLLVFAPSRLAVVSMLGLWGAGAGLSVLHILSLRSGAVNHAVQLDLSPGELLFELRLIFLQQVVLLALCFANWRFFRDQWRDRKLLPFALIASVLGINVVTILFRFQDHTDYKLWVVAAVFLGVLASPGVNRWLSVYPWRTSALLAVMLVPYVRPVQQNWLGLGSAQPPFVVRAECAHLGFADPADQAPFDWLADYTPSDAVIVEKTTAWSPVFARRSLFVGRHIPPDPKHLFGFLTPIETWLSDYCSFGPGLVERRGRLVDAVFAENDVIGPLVNQAKALRTIESEVVGRPVFVMARGTDEIRSVDKGVGTCLTVVASGDDWRIYRAVPETGSGL